MASWHNKPHAVKGRLRKATLNIKFNIAMTLQNVKQMFKFKSQFDPISHLDKISIKMVKIYTI